MSRSPLDEFKLQMAIMGNTFTPLILLCGAKPWEDSKDPDHRRHVPVGKWYTTDIEAGPGVDIIADLHELHKHTSGYNGIFCPSVLEHLSRPWVAIKAMAEALAPGGILYIHTHQTFPLHGYPNDYFRFSREALELMCHDANLHTLQSAYDGPCSITPPPECAVWNPIAESFLNVTICARKPE